MSRIKIILLSSLAVFALGAVTASAALAESETEQQYFENEAGKEPTLKGFTSTSGSGTLKTAGATITCKHDTNTGKLVGRESVKEVLVKFTECKGENLKTKATCAVKSEGGKSGEEAIETKDLKGELGETAESKTGVGLLLEGETSTVFVTVEGSCLPVKTSAIEGSVVGEVKPVEEFKKVLELVFPATKIKTFERSFAKNCKGAPAVRECKEDFKFEPKLTAFGTEAATETTTDETTYEEKLKVHKGS